MFTVDDIRRECARLDTLCGVDTSGFDFVISNRSVKRLGSFSYGPGRRPRITLSSVVLTDEKQFYDTLRHEYAHALVYLRYPNERHGHDKAWKTACIEVGAVPKRLASEEETRISRSMHAKYIVKCRRCGRESCYSRRGKIVDSLMRAERNVRCTICGSTDFALYIR